MVYIKVSVQEDVEKKRIKRIKKIRIRNEKHCVIQNINQIKIDIKDK
jgi:hypothetical protein